jgi:hypothetical protein
MTRFDFDDFDTHPTPPPVRELRPSGRNLCSGCKHAHLYRRQDSADLAVYCHELARYVPPDIVECSQFTAVAAPTLHEMQRIALSIDSRRGINDGSYR